MIWMPPWILLIAFERSDTTFNTGFQKRRTVDTNLTTKKGDFEMNEDEKKLLQAKHRLEEAQARNRVKERKARTRRLIQEGAILEKVFPAAAEMELTKLEEALYWALR